MKLIVLFMAGILLWTLNVWADPMVNLTLIGEPTAVGDTFQVEVRADGDDFGLELLAFGFDVAIDTTGILSYTGCTFESGFEEDLFAEADAAGSVLPMITENDVLLATLSFSVIGTGSTLLSIFGEYDTYGKGLYYALANEDLTGYTIDADLFITIPEAAQPVPEPASMILLGVGLICSPFVRRLKHTKK